MILYVDIFKVISCLLFHAVKSDSIVRASDLQSKVFNLSSDHSLLPKVVPSVIKHYNLIPDKGQ